MELLYAKKFSKDVDAIRKEAKIKKALLKVIKNCWSICNKIIRCPPITPHYG
jgi:mRNA-degrading endonuclease YafQ of YafQ-DinJ toxin-antitoxin module